MPRKTLAPKTPSNARTLHDRYILLVRGASACQATMKAMEKLPRGVRYAVTDLTEGSAMMGYVELTKPRIPKWVKVRFQGAQVIPTYEDRYVLRAAIRQRGDGMWLTEIGKWFVAPLPNVQDAADDLRSNVSLLLKVADEIDIIPKICCEHLAPASPTLYTIDSPCSPSSQ